MAPPCLLVTGSKPELLALETSMGLSGQWGLWGHMGLQWAFGGCPRNNRPLVATFQCLWFYLPRRPWDQDMPRPEGLREAGQGTGHGHQRMGHTLGVVFGGPMGSLREAQYTLMGEQAPHPHTWVSAPGGPPCLSQGKKRVYGGALNLPRVWEILTIKNLKSW